ncbi:hypothetical protein HZU67_06304 [Apis mellifera carnica]|nr:hypothetical protein HZU67_06304 [Apis mellifera carnica]
MKWSNITLHKPKKWITVNFQNISIISGKKHIYHNVQITKFSYDNLKFSLNKDLFLKDSKLCATFIFAPKIRTLFLTGNNITVQKLFSSHVFGNIGLYSINNSIVSFNPVLSEKKYCHNVIAKNIFALQLNNLNLTDLKKLINTWIEPNFLNTSISTINLTTNILRPPIQFYIELPKIIKNIIFEQNVLVNNINGINFSNFLLNTIKFNDMVSVQNITFRNGISTNDIYVSHLPFNLISAKEDLNLYKKRISGSIKINAINLPYIFKIIENKTLIDISIMGSVKFCYEPTIKNINNIKLKKLSSEIWMVTNTITTLHGRNMHFHDIMIKKYIALNNLTNILSFKMWKNNLKSILSKTKLQEIEFPASFNDIKISNIVSSNISTIKSSLSDFNNIFENSLLKNKDQEVKTKWIFNKLKISDTGNLYIKQTINNLYLKSDVMKHNSKENIVTGKKKVLALIVENLNGYNFNKWTANALMKTKKNIIIDGRKKFNIVTFNNIKMSRTLMGYAIEKVLRKSTNQIIYSQKTIQGFINASEFIINGLINDVNLTKLVHHQLKKNNPLQTIRTGIELHNNLNIIGNLTIKGAYEKSEMKIFDKNYSNAQTIIKRMKRFIRIAEIINIALQNRAMYINKLEIINDTIDAFNKSMIIQYNPVQCNSKKFSSYCISKYAKEFIFQTNIGNFILLQSIMMDEKEFIVLVKFNSISIYSFINIGNNFVHLKDLYFPNIMDAFVEQKWHGFGLWIILRLISQTLVLLYQPWGNIQQYILPVTDVFSINRSPNDQLLLLLSNGIWDLEGLASPRNIIEIPLKGRIETVVDRFNYYIKCISKNETTLMKARYV